MDVSIAQNRQGFLRAGNFVTLMIGGIQTPPPVSVAAHWGFIPGLIICLTLCGCTFSRDKLLDRPTQLEERVSVDDLADENSGFEAVEPGSGRKSSQSGTGNPLDSRRKLANWRDQREGSSKSIPLARTDQLKTADLSDPNSQTPQTSRSSNQSSPFDQALTATRPTQKSRNDSGESTLESSDNSNAISDIQDNPFED